MLYELINNELLQVEAIVTENQTAIVKRFLYEVYGYGGSEPITFEALPEVDVIVGKKPMLIYANNSLAWIYVDAEPVETQLHLVRENQLILMDAIATLYEDLIIGGV